MKTVWAFREVGTELLLVAWVSISWGLEVIVSGLIPNESKAFDISSVSRLVVGFLYVCVYIYIYIWSVYNLMSRGRAFHGGKAFRM